jgi:hypothetical protein
VDYDEVVYVVGLNINTLNFWINPDTPVSGSVITADVKINYQSITQTYCDTIKIIQIISSGTLQLLLSCPHEYFQITANLFSQYLVLNRQYLKYSNCDPTDSSKPVF